MRQITDIKELHGILLNIAMEFDKVCKEEGIPYYMIGGTLIGALRHKGFIPWDDDMDFGVPAECFEKLKTVLSRRFSSSRVANGQTPYRLITSDNSLATLTSAIKIEDTRTVVKEHEKSNEQCCGVFIDVFPMFKCNNRKDMASVNYWAQQLKRIQNYRFGYFKESKLSKKLLHTLVKVLFCTLDKSTMPRVADSYYIRNKGDYRMNYYGVYGLREIVKGKCLDGIIEMPFEDTSLNAPIGADEYLTSIYGDYMQLPPENKRRIHIQNMFYK